MTEHEQALRTTRRWEKAYHDAVIMGENPLELYVSQRDFNVWVIAGTGRSPKRGEKFYFLGIPLHPRRTLAPGHHAVVLGPGGSEDE